MRLFLLRHGDALSTEPNESDFDRKLSERGKAEIRRAAHFFKENIPKKVCVYCSSAKRTQETWEAISPAISPIDLQFSKDLYLAPSSSLLEVLKNTSDTIQTVLLIGHNSEISELAGTLLDQPINMKTGTLVQLDFPYFKEWKYLGYGTAIGGIIS